MTTGTTKTYTRPNFQKEVSGTTIELGQEVIVKQIPAYQIKATSIVITSITDDASSKTVTAHTVGVTGDIVLWTGAAYDAIGEWTDADVKARIIAILTGK